MKIKEFIKKLQNLPEERKKTILYIAVGAIAIILFFSWFNSAKKSFEQKNLNGAISPLIPSVNINLGENSQQIKDTGEKILEQLKQLNQQEIEKTKSTSTSTP